MLHFYTKNPKCLKIWETLMPNFIRTTEIFITCLHIKGWLLYVKVKQNQGKEGTGHPL